MTVGGERCMERMKNRQMKGDGKNLNILHKKDTASVPQFVSLLSLLSRADDES